MSICPYSIPNFLVSIYTFGLGIFILLSSPKSRKNQLCFLHNLCIFTWLFCYGILYSLKDLSTALTVSKIGHFGAIFVPVIFYLFIIEILGRYKKPLDTLIAKTAISLGVLAAIALNATPLYLDKLHQYFWGYNIIGGPLMLLYALWTCVLVVRAIYVLRRASQLAQKDFNRDDYQRFKYYSISLSIFSLAPVDYLAKFHIAVYPFGYIFVAAYASLITYSILRHQLFDIDIIIRRSFTYSLLVSALTLIYLSIILISEHFFRSYLGYSSLAIALIISCVVAISFDPLRLKIQRLIDRYFHKIDVDLVMRENVKLKVTVRQQDQLKAVATLAAGMAHEIKNPLTTIKTFAEFLPEKYDDPDFRATFSRIINDEVERANNIVIQLLEFAKPKDLQLKQESLAEILDDTLSLLSSNFVKSKIEVVKEYSLSTRVNVDKAQLKQAFINIVLNAVQAMPAGGTLIIKLDRWRNRQVRVSFLDTGVGIPKDKLSTIFEPFYTTKETGTGLGLSIVHGIITEHDAKIIVSSVVGVGTEVSVLFNASI